MEIPKTLYHLTADIHVPSILREGVKALVGENSYAVGEQRASVYLTEAEYLCTWGLVLGYNKVIEIDTSKLDEQYFTRRSYSYSAELLYSRDIPIEAIIKVSDVPLCSTRESLVLWSWYIKMLSDICISCVRAVSNADKARWMSSTVHSTLEVMSRFDASVLTADVVQDCMNELDEEGAYTMRDPYEKETHMIWEQLSNCPVDELTPTRVDLYNWIKSNIAKYF